jgi:GNAT superfamily N-acetyltransferase
LTTQNEVHLEFAEKSDAEQLAVISKRAFETDIEVGGPPPPGGPPGYDSADAQVWFMKAMDYYKIIWNNSIIGGLIIGKVKKDHPILERIFIDPKYQRKGLGLQVCELLWKKYPQALVWTLGTPEWNIRTKNFYEKLDFVQIGWEKDDPDWRGRWYQKTMDSSKLYHLNTVNELHGGMKNVIIEGNVTSLGKSRTVRSKEGKLLTVANTTFTDKTGSITLVLWNENISRVETGDRIRIEFGYVNSYQNTLQLNISRMGRMIFLSE